MSDKKGGPAFPVPNDANVNQQEGMTLRDYFAAKALVQCPCNAFSFTEMAEWAYAMADAMLEARK